MKNQIWHISSIRLFLSEGCGVCCAGFCRNLSSILLACALLLTGVFAGFTGENPTPKDPAIDGQFYRMMCDHCALYRMPKDRWTAETAIKRKVGCDALYLYGMLGSGWSLNRNDFLDYIMRTVETNQFPFFVVYSYPSLDTEQMRKLNDATREDARRFSKWPGFRGFCLDEPAAQPAYTPQFLAEFKTWLLARYAPTQLSELGLAALTNTTTLIVSPATTLSTTNNPALSNLYGRYRKELVDTELAGKAKEKGEAFSGEIFRQWAIETYDIEQLREMKLEVLLRSDTKLILPKPSAHKQKADSVGAFMDEVLPPPPIREIKATPQPVGIVLPVVYTNNPVLYMEFEEFACERFITAMAGMDSALREVKPDALFFPVLSFMSLLHMPFRSSLARSARTCSAISVDWYVDGAQDEVFWAKLMRNQATGPSFLTVTAGKYNTGPAAYARDLANGMVHSPAINIWAWCYAAPNPPDYFGADFYRPGNYAIMERMFERIDRIKPYLVPSASTARMALMFSERESMWDQQGKVAWPRWGGFVGNCYGLHAALAQLGMAYEPVFEELITRPDLDRYDVVIIPGITYLRPETVAALEDWVASGGALIAMGPVGTKDRWGRKTGASSIAGLTGVACRPPASKMGAFSLQNGPRTSYGSDISGSTLELSTAQAIGSWTNGSPAVAIRSEGRGKVVSVGAEKLGWSYNPVGRVRLSSYNIPRARRFFPGVLDTLRIIIKSGANGRESNWLLQAVSSSPDVEVTVRSQPGCHVMHLINYGAATNAQVDLRLPTETIGNITAFYPTDMSRADVKTTGRDVHLTVRNFDVHEAVVIQYEGNPPTLKEPCPGPVILPPPAPPKPAAGRGDAKSGGKTEAATINPDPKSQLNINTNDESAIILMQ